MLRTHRALLARRRRFSAAALTWIATWTGLLAAVHAPALAVTRACSGTPLANTADVLCAPPSGPCDGTTVVVSTKLVLTTSCTFDLGGRALVIDRPVEVRAELADIGVFGAGDVTITERAKIRARVPKNDLGGSVFIQSFGRIEHRGLIDVSARFAGEVQLIASGDVHLARRSKIRGNALAVLEEGERSGDGGFLSIFTDEGTGSVFAEGKMEFRGAPFDSGGTIEIFAARNVELRGSIKVAGGAFEGLFDVLAGDHIVVTGRIDARSAGSGDGGAIALQAGDDFGADAVVGGGIEIRSATIDARGGVDEQFGGRGGELIAEASGPITITDDVVIRTDAGAGGDGPGGFILLDSEDGVGEDGAIGPRDGDISIGGLLSARGGRRGGDRGDVSIIAGRNLTSTADIDVSGPKNGGVGMIAGEDAVIAGSIIGLASDRNGDPGFFTLRAGQFLNATSGEITLATDVVMRGGATTDVVHPMLIEGCRVVVDDGVVIDARGGVAGGSDLVLASVAPMQLGAGSRYLAGSGGSVTTKHPPGADPVIGAGVVFDPSRVDDPTAFSLPGCP